MIVHILVNSIKVKSELIYCFKYSLSCYAINVFLIYVNRRHKDNPCKRISPNQTLVAESYLIVAELSKVMSETGNIFQFNLFVK